MPDFERYHEAAVLRRTIDWIHGASQKKRVVLEENLSKVCLGQIIWVPRQYRDFTIDKAPITKETFRAWDRLFRTRLWQCNSPLMPLSATDLFPPGRENQLFLRWTFSDSLKLKDVLNGNVLCSIAELREKYGVTPWDAWRYKQLQHFADTLPRPFHSIKEPMGKTCGPGRNKWTWDI